jgi:folate-dependent phosphoribosylglycinamide formyltransferase PurN
MIAAFVYGFPHQKSVNGLLALKTAGYNDVVCLAAPKKQLNIPNSKIRITPKINPLHPKQVATALNFTYMTIDHDEPVITEILKHCKLGVILGARILKRHVTEALPIINLHPGDLPRNRSLDNIKHAVWNAWPQCITAHVVDQSIDRGFLIEKQIIDVYEDDSMMDIFIRMQAEEQHILPRAIQKVISGNYSKERLGKGNLFSAMPWEKEQFLLEKFEQYKKDYKNIC